jgi:DNA-directed RNA polymerase specialized sigma24 family protein
MADPGSVTTWLTLLQAGDTQAAQMMWDRYFPQLVRLARARLTGVRKGAADEEDVALSAFASFCRGIEKGRFPDLTDRSDLWKLLVVITARKACDLAVKSRRLKNGGGKVRGDSAFGSPEGEQTGQGIGDVIGREPSPEFAFWVGEQHRELLAALDDDFLRKVANSKLEGYTNQEIARLYKVSVPTVERKLQRIRQTWEQFFPQEDAADSEESA